MNQRNKSNRREHQPWKDARRSTKAEGDRRSKDQNEYQGAKWTQDRSGDNADGGKVYKEKKRQQEADQFMQRIHGEVARMGDRVLSNYERICDYVCSNEVTLDDEAISLLDDVTKLCRLYPQIVIQMAQKVGPPKWCQQLANDKRLVDNDKNSVGAFNYNDRLGKVIDNKYRYMFNMPGRRVISYLDKEEGSTNTDDENINAKLFMKYAHQSRWADIWRQIISAFIWRDTVTQANAWRHTNLTGSKRPRYACDLASIQMIAAIVARFDILPWHIKGDGGIVVNRKCATNWGTSTMPLLYSLLELSKEEKGCNIEYEAARVIIRYRVECAFTSFENESLTRKGIYSKALKWITSKAQNVVKVTYDDSLQIREVTDGPHAELCVDENEIEELETEMRDKMDPGWFKYLTTTIALCNKEDRHRNTETVRYLLMATQIISNPGIYYKTALTLEAVSSIEAHVENLCNNPRVKSVINLFGTQIPFQYDWESSARVWRDIRESYRARLQKIDDQLKNENYEQWYVSLLTNRSQGGKVAITDVLSGGINEEQSKLIMSVAQSRMAAFLLGNVDYYNLERFISGLRAKGVCTIRFQNNRRARIVEIVPNLDQTAYAIVLKAFMLIKSVSSEMAVGKQQGGVVDMSLQLRMTGDRLGVSVFSDVVAMDASTSPFEGSMFLYLLAEYLQEKQIANSRPYFAFGAHTVEVIDSNSGEVDTIEINPLSYCLVTVAAHILSKNFVLKDDLFREVDVNAAIFPSGRFDTSAQHTELLSDVGRIVYNELHSELSRLPCKIHQRKFGDDSYDGLQFFEEGERVEFVKKYINKVNEKLLTLGFKVDTEVSSTYGDFLQQMAYNGVCVPKSARSSIYCDERGNTMLRDPQAQLTVITNVISAASQRTYAPENVSTIVRAGWLMLRMMRIVTSRSIELRGRWVKHVLRYDNRAYFMFPYVYMFMPPLNNPNPNIRINGVVIPARAQMRSTGDSGLVWLFNALFTEDDWRQLLAVHVDQAGTSNTIAKPIDVLTLRVSGSVIMDCLILHTYNRSSTLSKQRSELLGPQISYMASLLSTYYNSHHMQQSIQAWVTLKDTYGISVPEHLAYWGQPIAKIKDLFSARTESVLDAVSLNDDFYAYLNMYAINIPRDLAQRVNANCYQIKVLNAHGEPSNYQFRVPPILPGYREYGDYYYHYIMVGDALHAKGKVSKLLGAIANKYGQNFDIETALKFGVKAYSKGSSALALFLKTLSLSPELTLELENAITTGAVTISDLSYSSGFQKDIQFAVNADVKALQLFVVANAGGNRSLERTMVIVARDFFLMHANMYSCSKLQVTPSAYTEAVFSGGAVLRKLGLATTTT